MIVETEFECCKIIAEDVENAIILEGSPGLGLIGNIVGWHIIENIGMRNIGFIESKDLPPISVLYKGIALHPFRIYEGDGMVIFLSDAVIPMKAVFEMTKAIVTWMDKNNARKVISFSGMPLREMEEQRKVLCAANNQNTLDELKEIGIQTMPFGNIPGLAGTLLTEARTKNIPASCLFAETTGPYPDPRAAASVIDILNKILDMELDPTPLLKEAEAIEARLKKLAEQVKTTRPEVPMYG